MFSGIIQTVGSVVGLEREGENLHLTLESEIAGELHVDQSVAHNGVCLTVVSVDASAGIYTVTAIRETLEKSNLGGLREGDLVNLERSMRMDGLLDGHIVQGHVDTTAVCESVEFADGSWYYTFTYEAPERLRKSGYVTVEKGSVAVNGVSLTVVNSREGSFQVAIIPYTHEHTNFHRIEPGTRVNLEFDIIGKYVARLLGTASEGR
ncbi:MAG: riboflavin synthase [Rikenella sp.]|nr:riboflavin synthase [Rikenella sp.]